LKPVKLGTHEPVQEPRQTILAFGRRRESDGKLGPHEKHGLRKSLSGNVVRLVDYERSERVKGARGPRAHAQGLNHGDYEIIFNLEIILLNSANR
jgi:hypothetical protein